MLEWEDMKDRLDWWWLVALLPPFNLLGVNSTWIVELVIVGVAVWSWWQEKEKRRTFWQYKTVWWFVGWTMIISLSAMEILYWPSFLKMWGKWLVGLAWMWIVSLKVQKKEIKKILNSLLVVFGLKLVLEAGLYGRVIKELEFKLLTSQLVNSIRANWLRERTIISFFNEPLVIVTWWLALGNKGWRRWLGWGLILGSGIIVFMSNWRGRMIVWVLAAMVGILVLSKRKLKDWLVGVLMVGLVFISLDRVMLASRGYSVVDRLLNKDKIEDKSTLNWRRKAFLEAGEMANYSWLGVGVGQFYNFTSLKGRLTPQIVHLDDASKYGPHNIFFQFLAETGWFGWLWLVVGLGWFGWLDSSRWWKYSLEMRLIVLMFWLTVMVVQFYPAISWEFVALFFGLRVLLMKETEMSNSEIG